MITAYNRAVGEFLKKRREALGLTITDLAKGVGFSYYKYREIERGKSSLFFEDAEKLADYMDFTLRDLQIYVREHKKVLTPEDKDR